MKLPARNLQTHPRLAVERLESRVLLTGDARLDADQRDGNGVVIGEVAPTDDGLVLEEPRVARIVGGQSAGEQYGWVASLQNAFGHICGGTLISRTVVVTAAHCVEGEAASSLRVVVGRSNLDQSDGQRIRVDRIVAHRGYDPFTNDTDIALLRLATPADETPIGFLTQTTVDLAAPGTDSLVLGWGATREDGPATSELQAVNIPIVSNETANAAIAYDGAVTPNMLAAGRASGGIDSCQGDSGGPLVVFDADDLPLLAGIVSWGAGCARPNKYGIYTRVSQFEDWIRENAQVDSPRGSIGFSPTRYLVGTEATISVEDTDLANQDSVQISVSAASGDSETLRLQAFAEGQFRGTVMLALGTAAHANGILEVAGAEQIHAQYIDEDDGSGNAREANAMADVVIDDWAGSPDTNATLEPGVEWRGEIDVTSDRDWFRLALNANQGYEIRVLLDEGTLDDSVLSLFADDGQTLLAIDDDGGRGLGSQTSYFSPVPRTVFVEVAGHGSNIGSYAVLVEEVDFDDDDHFDIFSLATPIALGESVDGTINYAHDRDWFQFETQAGELYQASVTPGGLRDSQLRLVDQDGHTELAFNDDRSSEDFSSRLHFFVERSGTYYLEVRGYQEEVGSYELEFGVSEDDHGNIPEEATPIGEIVGVDFVSGEITSFDEDWFSFVAEEGRYYEFETVFVGSLDELEDSVLQLFDATGERLLAANDDHEDRDFSKIVWQAPADGVYLLQVTGFGGDVGLYDVEFWSPVPPPNDDGGNYPAAAELLQAPVLVPRRIEFVADSDWFQMEAVSGYTYAIDVILGDLEDSVLRVWAEDGETLLAESDDATSNDLSSFLAWTAQLSATHYVQVLGYDGNLGSYQLELTILGDATRDGLLSAADIDALYLGLARNSSDGILDINGDERVNETDVDALIRDIFATVRGDVDLDGQVNFADFLALSASFGRSGGWADGDFNGDQEVGFEDFLMLSSNFGTDTSAFRTRRNVGQ